ncbi:MAG: hypothetical protein QOF14_5770 [Hyphomicrobiales bacterium]|jgi:hypothetical protein|nr:hypothetical protein [Hyphomicrobiales bacterium]
MTKSPTYFVDDASTVRRPVRLGNVIAQGAAGTIHKVIGQAGLVAKLYKNPKDLDEYRAKVAAMLATPPNLPNFRYNSREYVQIAWPTAKIIDGRGEFRGFLMPEVDFQASTELENILQKSSRARKQLPEFAGARVLLAANLAAVMADLHALGHFMIDMKPMNIRFYPHAWYLAILDTDGFSIGGATRVPARQFSDEYISPDARGKRPDQLGLEQDCFALAVIIFRLLNNGIHPYQGVDNGSHPSTLQERIFAGLYAYGTKPHANIKPTPSSIHEYLEGSTRALFDRSFHPKGHRPSAIEWRDHLNALIRSKVLVKCSTKPGEHAHFSKGCGLCALEKRTAQARRKQTIASTQGRPIAGGTVGTASATKVIQATSYRAKTSGQTGRKWLFGAAAVLLILYFINNGSRQSIPQLPTPSAQAPPQSPVPVPQIAISKVVLAKSVDGKGNPVDVARVFVGPAATVAMHAQYRNGKPYQDKLGAKLVGGGTVRQCNEIFAQHVEGTFFCEWRGLDAGEYTAFATLNGKSASQLSLTITAPEPIAPPAESPAIGGPFESAVPRLLADLSTAPLRCPSATGCTVQLVRGAWDIRMGDLGAPSENRLFVRPVNVRSDGRPAYLVASRDQVGCPSAGCLTVLWMDTGSGFRSVFDSLSIGFRESRTNGVQDIIEGYNGAGFEFQGPFQIHKWDGRAYVASGTIDLRLGLPNSVSLPAAQPGAAPQAEDQDTTTPQPRALSPAEVRQRQRDCTGEWREQMSSGLTWTQFMSECINRL